MNDVSGACALNFRFKEGDGEGGGGKWNGPVLEGYPAMDMETVWGVQAKDFNNFEFGRGSVGGRMPDPALTGTECDGGSR